MKKKTFKTLVIGARFRTTMGGAGHELKKISRSESADEDGAFTQHTPGQVVFRV